MVVVSQFGILTLLHGLRKNIWPINSQCNHPRHTHKTNQDITRHNSWPRVAEQKMQVEFRKTPRFVTSWLFRLRCCPVAMTLWRPWRCFSPPAWRTPSSEPPQRQAHEGRWGGLHRFSVGPFCWVLQTFFRGLKWWKPNLCILFSSVSDYLWIYGKLLVTIFWVLKRKDVK